MSWFLEKQLTGVIRFDIRYADEGFTGSGEAISDEPLIQDIEHGGNRS